MINIGIVIGVEACIDAGLVAPIARIVGLRRGIVGWIGLEGVERGCIIRVGEMGEETLLRNRLMG